MSQIFTSNNHNSNPRLLQLRADFETLYQSLIEKIGDEMEANRVLEASVLDLFPECQLATFIDLRDNLNSRRPISGTLYMFVSAAHNALARYARDQAQK